MIKLIYGEKGTGKTKVIIDAVNKAATEALGNVVFVSEKKAYSANIAFNVRCLYTEDYAVNDVKSMVGFVDGLMAGNTDIEYIFIDGILRIAKCEPADLQEFVTEAEKLSKEYGVKFILTILGTKNDFPDFLAKYCD